MDPMALIYVGVGGALGSMLRYACGSLINRFNFEFPVSTMTVNILGAFLMGVWIASMAVFIPAKAKDLHMLFAIGLLGGFTTFSSFTLELFLLADKGFYAQAAFYAVGSVTFCIVALLAGMFIVKLVAA
jgi:CrcB protein